MRFAALVQHGTNGLFRWEPISAETAAGAENVVMERFRRPAAALYETATIPHAAGAKKLGLAGQLMFWEAVQTAVKMGLSVLRGLRIAAESIPLKPVAAAAAAAREMVQTGVSFASALERLPNLGDKTLFALVRSAESGSRMKEGLTQIVSILKARAALRSAIKRALIYPMIVLLAAIALSVFLIYYIVPIFGEIFTELKASLPLPTRILIATSNFMKAHPVLMIGLLLVSLCLLAYSGRFITRPILVLGRPLLQRVVLRIPLVRKLLFLSWEALFARTFSALDASGMLPPVALLLCRQLSWSVDWGAAVARVRDQVATGVPMWQALSAEKTHFSPFLIAAVQVGETSSNIGETVGMYADNAEARLKEAAAALEKSLEPILIGFVAGVVGIIVAAMFLPLVSLVDAINKV